MPVFPDDELPVIGFRGNKKIATPQKKVDIEYIAAFYGDVPDGIKYITPCFTPLECELAVVYAYVCGGAEGYGVDTLERERARDFVLCKRSQYNAGLPMVLRDDVVVTLINWLYKNKETFQKLHKELSEQLQELRSQNDPSHK